MLATTFIPQFIMSSSASTITGSSTRLQPIFILASISCLSVGLLALSYAMKKKQMISWFSQKDNKPLVTVASTAEKKSCCCHGNKKDEDIIYDRDAEERVRRFYLSATDEKNAFVGFGSSQSSGNRLEEALTTALEAGYKHFDFAPKYCNEDTIGNVLKRYFGDDPIEARKKRESIVLASKLWMSDLRYERANWALDKTLKDLQLNYLDLWYLHWPVPVIPPDSPDDRFPKKPILDTTIDLETVWRTMEEHVYKGKVKALGVCNVSCKTLKYILSIAKIKPVAVQVECHLFLKQLDLLKLCKENDIALVAYSSIGSPGTYSKYKSDVPLQIELPVVKEIAEKNNITPAQVLLKWQIHRGVVPLTKSHQKEHIISNNQISNIILKDQEEDLKKLDQVDMVVRYTEANSILPEGLDRSILWEV